MQISPHEVSPLLYISCLIVTLGIYHTSIYGKIVTNLNIGTDNSLAI